MYELYTMQLCIVYTSVINFTYQYIRRSFLRQHVPGKLRKFVKLLTEDGREWNLRCHSTNHSTRLIGFGWVEFRQEYKLDKGDTCMFELVGADHESITLKASKK